MCSDGYLLRLHYSPGLCQEPHAHLLSGALTEPEQWVLLFLPLHDKKHWALVMLCIVVHAYGFSFQRATLKGMGRQWLLFFLPLSPQPSGFMHVQKSQQCHHFSIRYIYSCERCPSGLQHTDSYEQSFLSSHKGRGSLLGWDFDSREKALGIVKCSWMLIILSQDVAWWHS